MEMKPNTKHPKEIYGFSYILLSYEETNNYIH